MICYISPWHLTNSECLPFVCQQPQVRITLSSKLNRIGRWPFNHKVFNQRANRVCCSHLPPRSWKPELILKTVDSSGCLHLFMLSISSVSELLNFGFMGEPESASTVPMFLRGACFIQYDCHICLIRRCWNVQSLGSLKAGERFVISFHHSVLFPSRQSQNLSWAPVKVNASFFSTCAQWGRQNMHPQHNLILTR